MRKVLIGLLVFVLIAGLAGAYYYFRIFKKTNISQVPVGERSLVPSGEDINVSANSSYADMSIDITDKTLLSTYLGQYDFWNKEIPYYNPVNKAVIAKFKPNSLILVLANDTEAQYPFKVGELGSFNGFYDLQDQPGPLIINVFINPGQVSTLSEEDLSKRFSVISLSAINFFTQGINPVSVLPLVEPPAPFVSIRRTPRLRPTPVSLPSDYPDDQNPPGYVPENPNNNAPLE